MKVKTIRRGLAAALFALSLPSTAQVTLNIDAGTRGADIGSRHYGIFFEEINHAGDGGIYAELIRNRSFEDNSSSPDYWETIGGATANVMGDNLLNDAQEYALELTLSQSGDGIRNEGFWGINAVSGQTYKLSFWLKGEPSYSGVLTAELQTEDGKSLGSADITVDADDEWAKYTAEITAAGDDAEAYFVLTGNEAGTVRLDVVSLFPPTYNNRDNGCRSDLVEMLIAMKPAFMRFPGGCFVEGYYSDDKTNRFEWKKTIGGIEERPGHYNVNWGYRVSDGFGFHEMLQLAEDIGAEPLFVVNIGLGHSWMEEYTEIDEYIQEALDAIEYCNGDTTTTWGKLRAQNGHPEPFNLRLMEIGNENYNYTFDSNDDQSDHYPERYEQFREAINAQYPEVELIGNVESWSTDNPSWRNSCQVDLVDEHYYRDPAWMTGKYNKYDSYNRSNYKIYVGEYAVTSDYGTNGNLNAALGEAVFMLGMENNSDVCVMNSYAPLFVNENNYNWKPDLIRFNSSVAYGTPSYYVQKLFPNNIGTQNVTWTEEGNTASAATFKTGLSTWSTAAVFDNYSIVDADGDTLYATDFSTNDGWSGGEGGSWSISSETLCQTSTSMQGDIYVCDANVGDNYTLELEATKTSGDEGFLIVFNYEDDDNYCWWNLGGWGNTAHGVEVCADGSKSTAASVSASLETGQTYAIKIEVNGEKVKCWLDGTLIHTLTLSTDRNVYAAASIDDDEGMLYVKLVNPSETAQTVNINLANANVTEGTAVVMSGTTGYEENDADNPYNITPTETELSVSGTSFAYDVPAYSLNILRLSVKDVAISEEEAAELPDAVVQYSFENGAADDTGNYPATLTGDAAIVAMNDGNHALYNGYGNETAYLDLGTAMPSAVFPALTGDYTLSIDVALPTGSLTSEYSWALSFAEDANNYIGIYEGPDNTYWYYTVMDDGTSNDLTTAGGLSYDAWHNIAYVQEGNNATLYIDGIAVGEQAESLTLADLSDDIAYAFLGRSYANTDELMTNAYFDNLRIYNEALTAAQAALLYEEAAALSASSSEVTSASDEEQLTDLLSVLTFLHTSLSLPAQTDAGTNVTWTFEPANDDISKYIVLSSTELTVLALPSSEEGTLTAGILKAVTDDGAVSLEQTVRLAPDDERYGYLYCYMNSEEEITNFALGSKDDEGKVFYELLDGAEVFDTDEIAQIEGGTRDAFIGRGHDDDDGYFITTTDMCNATSGVWYNYGIDLLHSADLIHWEGTTFDFREGPSVFSDPDADTGVYEDDDYENICRVWAPQFIYDEEENAYLVYYSLLSNNDGDDYDRIFYSYADNTFTTLTQPRLLFDAGCAVIDADIIFNPYDSLYHIFYKHEGASGSERGVYEAVSAVLTRGDWTEILHVTNEETANVEAPSVIRRINEDIYNLYYMRYSDGSAYKYCELDNLGLNPSYSAALDGTGDFQHGSFMTLTEEEYTMLQAWSDVLLYLPTVEALEEESGSDVFTEAINQANEALGLTSVAELAAALPEAYENLKNCYYDYIAELALNTVQGDTLDLTFLLTNPDFSDGGDGWNGTEFTQATSGVAEFFNKTYNNYQILYNMPAGTYVLQCQGFYRYGSYNDAYAAHNNGTEELLAKLYLNDQQSSFMSLFDESAPYTYSPYTYPDGVDDANEAFNTDNAYDDNEVSCTLETTGTLKVGLCKTEAVTYDWNCFDNFRLYFIGGSATGIQSATSTASTDSDTADVFSLSGIKLRTAVPVGEALEGLPKGIYIVNGEKKTVR